MLISFSRPFGVDEAIAFATRRGATIEGFGYQVGDNFGYYPIPPTLSAKDASAAYRSEYELILGGLSEQMDAWSRQVPDESVRANVISQKRSLDQRRNADGHWSAIATGLYVSIGYSDLAALRAERSVDVLAIELWDQNRTALPIPILSELDK